MKVGIDLLALLPEVSGGIEHYAHNLLGSLLDQDRNSEYLLFTNLDNHEHYQHLETGRRQVRRILIPIHARPQFARIAIEQFCLPIIASVYRLDVLHSPTYTYPILARVSGVVTVHDLLYKTYPAAVGQPRLSFWRVLVPLSVRKCKRVIAISESAKSDLVRLLGVPASKIVVTPLAVEEGLQAREMALNEIESSCAKYRIHRPYLLYVGGIGIHKNPTCLLRALAALRARGQAMEFQLVITGRDYGVLGEVRESALALGLADVLVTPGYIQRDDLECLYAGASAYVCPSLFEGFGLTVLEAMAFGVPVVASNRASLPEVVGDAGLIADPDDIEAFAECTWKVLSDQDLRASLIRRGRERITHFSWSVTAQGTLVALRAAASQH